MKATPDAARRLARLYVVATPIGNLEDITLRALRVLREVSLVAAEDTRRTGNLLRHYEIRTPLVSVHEHIERQRAGQVIARLQAGESVALVTDAGTPGISDPGAPLVHAVRAAGFPVDAIPGPSAVTAALSAAGIGFDRFAFAGFPPIKSKNRNEWFLWVSSLDVPVVCFEAPHRIQRTLAECSNKLVNRPIIAVRELTKAFEEWVEGSAEEVAAQVGEGRGEFVFIVCPAAPASTSAEAPTDEEVALLFGQITDNNVLSRREAIRTASQKLHLSARDVYSALERHKKSVK